MLTPSNLKEEIVKASLQNAGAWPFFTFKWKLRISTRRSCFLTMQRPFFSQQNSWEKKSRASMNVKALNKAASCPWYLLQPRKSRIGDLKEFLLCVLTMTRKYVCLGGNYMKKFKLLKAVSATQHFVEHQFIPIIAEDYRLTTHLLLHKQLYTRFFTFKTAFLDRLGHQQNTLKMV